MNPFAETRRFVSVVVRVADGSNGGRQGVADSENSLGGFRGELFRSRGKRGYLPRAGTGAATRPDGAFLSHGPPTIYIRAGAGAGTARVALLPPSPSQIRANLLLGPDPGGLVAFAEQVHHGRVVLALQVGVVVAVVSGTVGVTHGCGCFLATHGAASFVAVAVYVYFVVVIEIWS